MDAPSLPELPRGWKMAWMDEDSPELKKHLAQGWEPFAVTSCEGCPDRIYLRKKVGQ